MNDKRPPARKPSSKPGSKHISAGGKPRPKKGPPHRHERELDEDRPVWLYGRHAVAAALKNPDRKIHRLVATLNAAQWLTDQGIEATPDDLKPDAIDGMLPPGSVHQGLAAYVDELPRARLKETCQPVAGENRPVIVLDQVTDVHNIGAIFRTAAAFNARAIIVQERRTPPLAGALAKAAAGAVDIVPCVQAVNIARSLEALKEMGYFCAGLAGEAVALIADMPKEKPVVLVMGAEGAGLRDLVGQTCDMLVRIPISAEMDSLNVSNAAAIALYEIAR
ncbi:23S rRNA (guanosine(2251)-2'-O)-methyltransferase RlmB [Aquisalinus flavus]|nr:23S rRNA (guanosine(2251)-2'-O)-methyltransferase RlmB [Aquisalinus flavus]MBD0427896.1 23S rRNA (guanosine(2251)-2'-O)-methyltransferase RlmB [Aquisalinus flavus]UNE47657.1 23S rRNA (guanosine(2251)-2'-O)-methyltransferase RlmB [Aquisalinus flavus]